MTAARATGDQGFSPGGDRDSLTLRPDDEALIAAVVAANPRVIVAIMAGSTVIIDAWRARVPAVLMLWYPGMEGGHALADVLFGRVNPSGRLPVVVPRRAEDLPHFDKNARQFAYGLWHGHRKLDRDGVTPAFPFGFGLSYTQFTYAHLRVEREGGDLLAAVDVTNTGDRAGDDVVQLYVGVRDSRVERAPRQLVAFARVALAPGDTRTVHLRVPVSGLGYYDESRGRFVVEPAVYEFIAGGHSLDPSAVGASLFVQAHDA
jgi:beta-glucosidase